MRERKRDRQEHRQPDKQTVGRISEIKRVVEKKENSCAKTFMIKKKL